MKHASKIFLAFPLLLSNLASAISLDCSHIRVNNKKFDLSKIGGPHSVLVHDEARPPAFYNTTWTVDICQPLKKIKGIPNADQCEAGTHVCGIVKSWNPNDDPDGEHVQVENVIPVAGNLISSGGTLDPIYTRLKETDSDVEGVQIELHGGFWDNKKQKAVINFECDKSRTGNEGNEDTTSAAKLVKRVDEEDDDDDDDDDINSLTFVSYGPVDGEKPTDVLRLNWKTKYACEDFVEEEDGDDNNDDDKKGGWGFFTWFILIAFLGIAAYLIFGSWLNYNRYGARGWDLLPHGDTIRDIPYLVKDWSRKVVDTVQGGGSRGGYSAV